MRNLILTTLSLLLLISKSKSDAHFPSLTYQKILNLDLDTSYRHPTNANSAYEVLIHDQLDMMYSLLKDEDLVYEALSHRQEARLDYLKVSNPPDSLNTYIKAELHLHWALIALLRGDNISAGWQLRKGYKGLEQLKKDFPNFADAQKSLGLLHVFMSAIPSEYQWLIQIFGFENNLTKGLNELHFASEHGEHFGQEAALLLAFVEGFILNDGLAGLARIEQISARSPSNLVDLVYIIYCNKIGKNELALEKMKSFQKKGFGPSILPIVKLLNGEIYLKKGLYSEAAFYLKSFDVIYNGNAFQKEARLKLFYALLLNGDKKEAQKLISKPLKKGSDIAASDRYANSVLNDSSWPNEILLKSRLLYDGGYFEASENELKKFYLLSTITTKDNAEYYYRYGRIYQARNDLSKAISSFEKCVEIQGEASYYFAPNACLQIGLIKKEDGDLQSAKEWLEKAMSYNKNPYQRSIENQAKTAINGL